MKSRFLLASFFVLPLALTAPAAQAQTFSVTATADANGSGESHTNPTYASAMGNFYNSAFSGDGTYPNVSSANVSVTGQQGLITGSAGSSTYDTAFSHANATANWTDALTITSSSLAPGAPVEITLFASYQASTYESVFNPLAGGISGASSSLDFQTTITDAATGVATPLVFKKTDTASYLQATQNYNMTLQGTLDTTIGATVNLASLVNMTAAGGVTFQGFKVSTQATVGFSSAVYVNAPDGVSIVSASGHSYAVPTPAPASLPVFAAGMGALIFGLRRRKNRSASR